MHRTAVSRPVKTFYNANIFLPNSSTKRTKQRTIIFRKMILMHYLTKCAGLVEVVVLFLNSINTHFRYFRLTFLEPSIMYPIFKFMYACNIFTITLIIWFK